MKPAAARARFCFSSSLSLSLSLTLCSSLSWPLLRGRRKRGSRRWARPIYIRPCSLSLPSVSVPTHTGTRWPPLIKRALASASHAHAYPLLRAQRTSAHHGDTEAPRMPCCANNTTAHVRDISFYYYPPVRSLPFPLSPHTAPPRAAALSLPRPFPLFLDLGFCSCSFFFLFHRYYFSSSYLASVSFCLRGC